MQSPASPHEWIMNANAISKPRYSAAVNAIPQSCASLPPFFFSPRNASPPPSTGSDATGKARSSLLQAQRGELRTLNRRAKPSLHDPSLLFQLPFFTLSRPRYSGYFSSSSSSFSSTSFCSCSFASFSNVHARQKAFHRGTPNRSSY